LGLALLATNCDGSVDSSREWPEIVGRLDRVKLIEDVVIVAAGPTR
jgi:hypothetical protein